MRDNIVCNNYLLVKILPSKDKSKGGVILTDKSIKPSQWGVVLDVGEGLADFTGNVWKPPFKIGDRVFFMQHAPELIDYTPEGLEKLHVISEGDVYLKATVLEDDTVVMPIGNYILIEPLDDSVRKTTPGGIILPDSKVERPDKARVIAVGDGQRVAGGNVALPLSPGDTIRYRKHSTFKIDLSDILPDKKLEIIGYGDVISVELPNFIETLKERLNGHFSSHAG